ncbi:MAG: hypothetical protein ACRD2P_14490 [Terriglobia bacterium]
MGSIETAEVQKQNSALPVPGCKMRLIMAVRFYGDESEDKEEKVHAIAGFIGFAEDWDRLQEEWISRVKPTGVSAYHMTDCDNGWGEFSEKKGWTKTDRDQLTKDLIEMICRHGVYLIGMAVMLDDYKTLQPLNDEGEMLGHDKWHLAFQFVLREACSRVGDEAPPKETVAFFFDWKTKQGVAKRLFDYTMGLDRLQPWHKRLETLTFGHKEFDVPGSIPLLQVADIAAVESRKVLANSITHPHLPERRSLARLKECNRVWSIRYLDKPVIDMLYEDKRRKMALLNKYEETFFKLKKLRSD